MTGLLNGKMLEELTALFLLSVCSLTDMRRRTVVLTPIAAAAGLELLIRSLSGGFVPSELFYELLFGGMFFLISFFSGGLGEGDAYLITALAVIIGYERCMKTVMYALFTAAFSGIIGIVSEGIGLRREIPFVPFLLGGFIIMLCIG